MLTEKDKQTISNCLAKIANSLPGFQSRAGQRKMIAEVAKVFSRIKKAATEQNGETFLVIEGPTGTGKSLAYLLPAIVMAKSLDKKLVVSSATIALQEQLANNDLLFLAKHAGLTVFYKLAKGRARYACPLKLEQINATPTAAKKFKQLATMLDKDKWSGDRDTLAKPIADELWSQITNDRHGCIKHLCPHFSKCPFFIARKQLDDADVIITNHDLLLSDIAMGGGVVLPDPAETFYCIDEAHHLADKAVKQFAAHHSINGTLSWLEKIKPTLNRIALATKSHQHTEKIQTLSEDIAKDLIDLRALLGSIAELTPQRHVKFSAPILRFPHGILPSGFSSISHNLVSRSQSLKTQLSLLIEIIKKKITEHAPGENKLFEKSLSELGFFYSRVSNLVDVWQLMTTFPSSHEPPIAKWFSSAFINKNNEIEYNVDASRVRASDVLREHFWNKAAGVVMTSATLRSLGSFNMLLESNGLNHFTNTTCIALDSPFNFREQGRLVIPSMQADPKESTKHTEEITALLPSLIQTQGGIGTLVLFSSKKQMTEVTSGLPETVQKLLLVQGNQSKESLLKEHFLRIESNEPSILFGLASFAEGLDLPGNACKHVVIAKLPFSAPDDPITQTLSEWIEARGGNSFFEITLPQASIKLIQAVGRLIRSETDTGTVTILDTRLKTKPYGRLMLKSLPPFYLA